MYTADEFIEYIKNKRGTGQTTNMIDRVVEYVAEDPANNVPEVVVDSQGSAKIICEIIKQRGVEKFEISSSGNVKMFGVHTTATFFDHTVAEYNMVNALKIYEMQIKDSFDPNN